MKTQLLKGNNLDLLKTLQPNSVDAVVCDPPYGIAFMNKKWDYDVPSVELWKEVYRVLKPGGHILSFGGTRTYHRMVVNIEDAGFEIRDCIQWIYGSGFPKSLNIGKAMDKFEGNEREYLGEDPVKSKKRPKKNEKQWNTYSPTKYDNSITKGNTEWEGWGTALKPANEPIVLARKPLDKKTIVENVKEWGTGGINIDGCRVATDDKLGRIVTPQKEKTSYSLHNEVKEYNYSDEVGGRFPANVILDEEAAKVMDEQSGNVKLTPFPDEYEGGFGSSDNCYNKGKVKYTRGYSDKGGASRFFYVAKVGKKERNMGLDDFEDKENYQKGNYGSSICKTCGKTDNGSNNHEDCGDDNFIYNPSSIKVKNNHPTIKPINLLTYLIRLITPPNGVVLDMYMGSGSTGIAALLEGKSFIGMEMDEEYFNIAEARINNYEMYKKLLK